MQRFRIWWNSFKTVAILFSFIMNLVTIIVLSLVIMQIFQIKNGILEPLIDGLHRNFVGLDEARIIRTIQVEDEIIVEDTIPVVFDLPLKQSTNVVLTDNVPIVANATFTLPGGGGMINGRVDIVLPKDLVLPVQLDMIVPVNYNLPLHLPVPINLPVPVEIPLNETQLHDPFTNLRDLLEPYVRIMDHLPHEWSEVPDFAVDAIQGEGVNLVAPSEDSQNPWPGFTTGLAQPTIEAGPEVPESAGENGGEARPELPALTPTPVQDFGIIIITPPPQ